MVQDLHCKLYPCLKIDHLSISLHMQVYRTGSKVYHNHAFYSISIHHHTYHHLDNKISLHHALIRLACGLSTGCLIRSFLIHIPTHQLSLYLFQSHEFHQRILETAAHYLLFSMLFGCWLENWMKSFKVRSDIEYE